MRGVEGKRGQARGLPVRSLLCYARGAEGKRGQAQGPARTGGREREMVEYGA